MKSKKISRPIFYVDIVDKETSDETPPITQPKETVETVQESSNKTDNETGIQNQTDYKKI